MFFLILLQLFKIMTNNNQFKNDVFISYNHKSKNHVEGLYNILTEQYGLRVWIDFKKIQIGDNLSLVINEGLKESRIVIACISKSYAQSRSCQNEIVLTQEYQKPLLVITLEELKLKDIPEISFYISNLNRCSLYKIIKDGGDIWKSEKFKDEVLNTLGTLLKMDFLSSVVTKQAIVQTNTSKWIESLPFIELENWSYLISTPSDGQKRSK